MGRALALVEAVDNTTMEIISLRTYFDHVNRIGLAIRRRTSSRSSIPSLPRSRPNYQPEQQGAFIPAGGVFDGYQAVLKAVAAAKKSIFFIDPYGDDTLISDFVPLAPESLPVSVMSDEEYAKPSLKPAACAGSHQINRLKCGRPRGRRS